MIGLLEVFLTMLELFNATLSPDGSGARSIFVIEHRAPFSQSNIEVLAGKRRKTVFQTAV